MSARASLTLLALLASSAGAAPAIDPQFGSHAVIQRDKPVTLSGTAAAGEHVSVNFAGATRQAVADKAGHWRAHFPAIGAGGPYTVNVTGPGGTKRSSTKTSTESG